jgi:hypothetical protein
LTALIGALAGVHGTSRRLIQDYCQSVLPIPMSLGGMQTVLDRVSQAIAPHSDAIASLARQAPVGSIDETPWYYHTTLQGLWTMDQGHRGVVPDPSPALAGSLCCFD